MSSPASTAARTSLPRSMPGIERPEPVPIDPSKAIAKAGRRNFSFRRAATSPTTPWMPSLARCDNGRALGVRFGQGHLQHRGLDGLAFAVEPVEIFGDAPRLDFVAHREEFRAERRVADPSAGIDPRSDQKAEVIGIRRAAGAGDIEQSGEPRPAPRAHQSEALDDQGAVQARQRRDIGDRRQRHEIEAQKKIGLRPRRVPKAACAQNSVRGDQRHEYDARGAKLAEAREIVLAVRIDHNRLGQDFRRLMMVEDDRVETEAWPPRPAPHGSSCRNRRRRGVSRPARANSPIAFTFGP